ncbi:MAG: 2-oxo acid dehydrogenase subunit E2 [Gammaproteobacteria bacterium]|nr:2-oxo acid dehydrogenase subunit E2 [Gammaproteobacteria bacterium]
MSHNIRELTLPALGEGAATGQGTVIAAPFSAGDAVQAGDTLLEVETDKVTLDIPAEEDGTLESMLVTVGDEVQTGQVFATVSVATATGHPQTNEPGQTLSPKTPPSDTSSTPAVKPAALDATPAKPGPERTLAPANPSTRRLARELGVNLVGMTGTGKHGRITKDDVKRYAKQQIQATAQTPEDRLVDRPLPDFSAFGTTHREPLSNIATATCNNMTHAWTRIPHAWLQETMDITDLEDWRQQNKEKVRQLGGSLTLTVLLAKAVATTLQSFPKLNSSYDEQANEIVYKDYIDIGIAVDTERGLIVPTLRQVNQKGLIALSSELSQLSEKARTNKLNPRDLQGASMTISNLGGMGLSAIFPIVNWPQVAIIGLGASEVEPRFHQGECVPRRRLTVTLGFDHRIINGADGAQFLVHLKTLIEDVRLMLL